MRHFSAITFLLALSSGNTLAQNPVREVSLRAHLAFLADDLLEGRGTGQRGADLTVRYLETQAAVIGLKPANAGGYRQAVRMIGTKTLPSSTVSFDVNGKTLSPQFGTGIVYGSAGADTEVRFDAPVVFVGYGITAEDEHWDDYKGIDAKGKVLVMMVNDPQPTAAEPNRFGGQSLTYYGRWTYKFEEALRRGAAGVLLIHTTDSASYPWSVPALRYTQEQFHLAGPGNEFEGWLHEDAARALFAAAGQDLDVLRAAAETRDFKPVDLGALVHVAMTNEIREIEQYNVAGIVPGTDPKLEQQAVVYSAHWDHFGSDQKTHRIWNGAVDNASGSAALLAMAEVAAAHPARRTQIFLWPCAEEQGLLGSLAYVRSPLWPLAKTAADLNLDSMNFVGRTRDIGVAGSERSTLYATAKEVAKRMGLRLAPAIPDLSGSYFRADHFNFAKVGVPAFNVGSAVFSGDGHFDFVEDAMASQAKLVGFKKDYHQVTDKYHAEWDLSGMVQQAQFTLNLGYAVADAAAMPAWNPQDPLSRVRR